ncbi:MAG: hypothetical protein SCH98_11600 [Deferrisomatales bacterium]|nr:hypothetical protein [Deferrisomatales bacterium]
MRKRTCSRRAFLAAGVTALAGAGPAWASCAPTPPNAEGPFYLPGAPFRDVLAPDDEPGERLEIRGRVLGAPDCRPLVGAVLDVWHASAEGFYYNLEGPADPQSYGLRGRVAADGESAYSLRTVLPGHYRLTRTRWRPRHLHFRVSHAGYSTLVTQLYFAGDPHLEGDPFVLPSLVIPLERAPGGGLQGTFDVHLGRA